MKRREFRRSVKVEIIRRAMADTGDLRCEKCNCAIASGEIHHLREDGLEIDKSMPLTAADGALWCVPCHKEHTATVSVPIIAKAKRREAKHLGAARDKPPIKSDPHALKSRRRPSHEGRGCLPVRPMFVTQEKSK
jgi:hypothetical protein